MCPEMSIFSLIDRNLTNMDLKIRYPFPFNQNRIYIISIRFWFNQMIYSTIRLMGELIIRYIRPDIPYSFEA